MDLSRIARAKDPRGTDDLIQVALADPNGDAASEAVHILQARGTRAELEAAVALAHGMRWEERRLAAEILGQLGWSDLTFLDESVELLLELTDDSRRDVTIAATFGLGHRGSSRALERLLELAPHADAEVRHGVAFSLPQVSSEPRAIAALLKLMRDPDEDVRDWATFGLGSQLDEIDGPEVRAALFERASDEHDDTRCEALVGLAQRRDPRALALIRDELEREDPNSLAADAARLLADRSLVAPLRSVLDRVEDDPDMDEYYVRCFRTALEACERRELES